MMILQNRSFTGIKKIFNLLFKMKFLSHGLFPLSKVMLTQYLRMALNIELWLEEASISQVHDIIIVESIYKVLLLISSKFKKEYNMKIRFLLSSL